jgi:serine/threonine protein phosphatase PrpC
MKYNISSFTHIGSKRKVNQDRILINDKILSDGFYSLDDQNACFCFVADGIGGGLAGEIASQFVLDAILKQKENFHKLEEEIIEEELYSVNNELINFADLKPEYRGTGTTLTGIIALEDANYLTIHAGDSEMWVLRDGLFFQVTESQVLDDSEPGSPLISYFGGKKPN